MTQMRAKITKTFSGDGTYGKQHSLTVVDEQGQTRYINIGYDERGHEDVAKLVKNLPEGMQVWIQPGNSDTKAFLRFPPKDGEKAPVGEDFQSQPQPAAQSGLPSF